MAEYLVVEESESLVDVGENPGVGIDVEAVDHLKNLTSQCIVTVGSAVLSSSFGPEDEGAGTQNFRTQRLLIAASATDQFEKPTKQSYVRHPRGKVGTWHRYQSD